MIPEEAFFLQFVAICGMMAPFWKRGDSVGGVETYESVTIEVNAMMDRWADVGWSVVTVALYGIFCAGLHSAGRRRGLAHSWLAWIPVANLWLLGSISDQFQYLVKGKIRSRRIILLVLAVATLIMYVVGAYCVYLSAELGYIKATYFTMPMLMAFVSVVLVLAGAVTAIVYLYMSCYDLFCSCDPDNKKLFLVLTILFPESLPFIVFAIRNRDGGMPPRKKRTETLIEETEENEEMTEELKGEPENEQTIPVADA